MTRKLEKKKFKHQINENQIQYPFQILISFKKIIFILFLKHFDDFIGSASS